MKSVDKYNERHKRMLELAKTIKVADSKHVVLPKKKSDPKRPLTPSR